MAALVNKLRIVYRAAYNCHGLKFEAAHISPFTTTTHLAGLIQLYNIFKQAAHKHLHIL